MANWNGFDFFILLIFAANLFLGMSRGATKEIIYMMCLSLALIFTIKFTVPLARFLNSSPLMIDVISSSFVKRFISALGAPALTMDLLREIAYSISMLVCFFVPYSIAAGAVAMGGFVEYFPFPYAALNRKIGGVLGFTRGYIYSVMLIVILTLHIFSNTGGAGSTIYQNSYFVNLFKGSAKTFDSIIASQNPDAYREMFKGKNLYSPAEIIKQLSEDPNAATPNQQFQQYRQQEQRRYQQQQQPRQQPLQQPRQQPQQQPIQNNLYQ